MIRVPESGRSESGFRNSESGDSESAKRISLGGIRSNDRMPEQILVVTEYSLSSYFGFFFADFYSFQWDSCVFTVPNSFYAEKLIFLDRCRSVLGGV